MKIALVQLDANDGLWKSADMPKILELVKTADLIVFPECMPYDTATPIEEAEANLASLSRSSNSPAFIAGGYVVEDGIERNAVFLAHAGKIIDHYYKRIPWQEPQISPGGEIKRFDWDGMSCIPLICADAADNPSPTGTRMMYEALRRGAGIGVPIVIASYGAGLFKPYWQDPLQAWANGTGATVVICGVSGKGGSFIDNGETGNYGGGGSGVFWPDERDPIQRKRRGIYIVDTEYGVVKTVQIPRK